MYSRFAVTLIKNIHPRVKTLCAIACAVLIAGCVQSFTPQEYIDRYETMKEKNIYTIERNGFRVAVMEQPAQLYIAHQKLCDTSLSIDTLQHRYANALYIVFELSSQKYGSNSPLLYRDGAGAEKITQNLYYNSFSRKNDIFLIHGNDTIKAVECQFEPNHSSGTGDMFVATFDCGAKRRNLIKYTLIFRTQISEMGTLEIAMKKLMHWKGIVEG